jgi:hypothetical protein
VQDYAASTASTRTMEAIPAPESRMPTRERPDPDEARLIAEMTRILKRKMTADYAPGATLRDAHPKTVGLVRGRFAVEPDLPREWRVGVFKAATSCDCWVRFSNSSGTPQADTKPDARGVAIKLMDGDAPLGQDFILLSAPTMPLGTVALFRDAVHYAIESSPLLLGAKLLLTLQPGVLLGLAALRIRPASLLDIRYWSTTPYRFGKNHAVKYSLVPTSVRRTKRRADAGDDYLSEAMQAHLDKAIATFDFCVQRRVGDMPIEDAAVRWDERRSPFVKLATLTIPIQKLRTPARRALAESLSFSPGNAKPAHAPLGGLNRARVKIYKALSRFRHARDGREDLS